MLIVCISCLSTVDRFTDRGDLRRCATVCREQSLLEIQLGCTGLQLVVSEPWLLQFEVLRLSHDLLPVMWCVCGRMSVDTAPSADIFGCISSAEVSETRLGAVSFFCFIRPT